MYAIETEAAIILNLCGKTWMDLDDDKVRERLDKVQQLNSPAGYMAGSVGMLIGAGTINWPVPAIDTTRIVDTTSRISGVTGNGNTDENISANPISEMGNNSGLPAFFIYPNPTLGNFTTSATSAGTFVLYTLVGQKIQDYVVNVGQTNLSLPATLANGMYMGVFKPSDGSKSREVKLMYQR